MIPPVQRSWSSRHILSRDSVMQCGYHIVKGTLEEMGNVLCLCCDSYVGATQFIFVHLAKVAESFSLICVLRSVRAGSWGRRSSLSLITTGVLPFDQTHIYKREEHASSGECHLDTCSACVSWAFRCREEVSRADSKMMVSLYFVLGLRVNTYATACARATARGTATARRDSLPALLADQVTISGVQTGSDS
jgi:hypothetical protein